MLFRQAPAAAAIYTLTLGMAPAQQTAPNTQTTRIYHIVFLKRDPARKAIGKEEGDRIQAAHMANIHALAERGVLVAAGPFDDTPPVISGVFFFTTRTLEEARGVAAADPTVAEHRNTVNVLAWRGPAGIGEEYMRLHKEQPGAPEGMGVHPFAILRRAGKGPDPALMTQSADYWTGMRNRGKVLAAGEVEGDNSAVAIVIFNRITDGEAASLAANDPAVRASGVTAEAHRWWCAAHVFPR